MKKQFGQFFTTNSDYILQGLEKYVQGKEISDPFAGNQDLLKWAHAHHCKGAIGFDCDERYNDKQNVFFNDSINSPKPYKFICTNPPYLHKNKADRNTKAQFFFGAHSQFEDLYQVSIFSLLNCEEGILIVPLNFLSAENSQKIRDLFFSRFTIIKLNIFSEQVFDDTAYNVVSFYFRRKKNEAERNEISATIFPEKKQVSFIVEQKYHWQLGGDFIHHIKNARNILGVSRLTDRFLRSGEYEVVLAFQNIKDKQYLRISEDTKRLIERNILFLRAIDSKNGKKIQIEDIRNYGVAGLVGKNTSRTMAHLIFARALSIQKQLGLMKRFNEELNYGRSKYMSYFLTNFRDNNRKRISFEFAYKFVNYIYERENPKYSCHNQDITTKERGEKNYRKIFCSSGRFAGKIF